MRIIPLNVVSFDKYKKDIISSISKETARQLYRRERYKKDRKGEDSLDILMEVILNLEDNDPIILTNEIKKWTFKSNHRYVDLYFNEIVEDTLNILVNTVSKLKKNKS